MTGIRALVALCVAMGVLIVAGTTVLVAVVAHRLAHGHGAPESVPIESAGGGTAVPERATLDEPPGSRIVGMSRGADRSLVLQVAGGGRPDRVVVWDLSAGRKLEEITVGTGPGSPP